MAWGEGGTSPAPAEAACGAVGGGGPDFLCIGQQKAGTQWLYDVLRGEPALWMPPLKEIHFFDGRFPVERARALRTRALTEPDALNAERRAERLRPLDGRDLRFLDHAVGYRPERATAAWYRALFAPKGDRRSGDVTPGYSMLERPAIERIQRELPDLVLVLMLRDPVSRAWSQFQMNARRNARGADGSLQAERFRALGEPARLERFLASRTARGRSFPSEIHARWSDVFGPERIHVDFLDHVASDPAGVRRRLLAFLGVPASGEPDPERLRFNRKSDYPKRPMTAAAERVLVACFRDELRRCAERFGGPAEVWLDRYSS